MNTKTESNYLNKQSKKKTFISLKESFMQISLIFKKPTTSLLRNFCQIYNRKIINVEPKS